MCTVLTLQSAYINVSLCVLYIDCLYTQLRDGHTPDKPFNDFQDPPKSCFVRSTPAKKHPNHPNPTSKNIHEW